MRGQGKNGTLEISSSNNLPLVMLGKPSSNPSLTLKFVEAGR